MKVSSNGIALLHHFESCELVAYPDPNSALGVACTKRKLPMRGYRKVANWEALSGDPWTIGWGHTGLDVEEGLVWSQQIADDTFRRDLEFREQAVDKFVTVPLTQGQFDAMVSIIYNVGIGGTKKDGIVFLRNRQPSTLLRKLNNGDYAGAAFEFKRWISKGSAAERGLYIRRMAETALFNGQDWRAAAEAARLATAK